MEQLRDIGADIPAKVGFALTGIRPKFPHIAGMDERWDGIGQAVVDLTLSLLRNQETGVPRFPRFGLVNGQWVEGRTIRRPNDRP